MFKKSILSLFTLFIVFTILVAGCSSNNNTSNETQEPAATTEPAATEKPAEDPDDMSQKLTITLMENGWVNQPFKDNDEIKQWMDKRYNVDFKLLNVLEEELEQKLLLAFSTSDHPDIIFSYNKVTLQKLVDQGVVIPDWTPYLPKIPTRAEHMNDARKSLVTLDGKIQALTVVPEAQSWSLMVRKDWMTNLNLSTPTTDDEFYDMLKKFTFDDPDKDGKNNTWGLTSAGANIGMGNIFGLESMFGPVSSYKKEGLPTFYIGSDGKLTNNILAGYHKDFLDFMRNAVKDKIISPDWYTQDWNAMQDDIYMKTAPNKSGTAWYPPLALVTESDRRNEEPGAASEVWMEMKMPKGSDIGGKAPSTDIVRGYITISKAAAEDPVRLSRVLKILEDTAFPNPGHYALKEGEGVEGLNVKLLDLGDGNKYWDTGNQTDPRTTDPGMYDYGTWVATDDKVIMGSGPKPDATTLYGVEMTNRVLAYETYENINARINLDPQVQTYLEKIVLEFNIKYILGNTDDYEGFKDNWLKQGGQKLLDQANEQLGLK